MVLTRLGVGIVTAVTVKFFYVLQKRLGAIVNTLTLLIYSGVRLCFIYTLLTRLEITIETVTLVLSIFLFYML